MSLACTSKVVLAPPGRSAQLTFFCTFPALMQPVQTWRRFGEPSTMARIRWMFGFQRRLVRRWEWLTAMPKLGFLPHTSQIAAMTCTPRTGTLGERKLDGW